MVCKTQGDIEIDTAHYIKAVLWMNERMNSVCAMLYSQHINCYVHFFPVRSSDFLRIILSLSLSPIFLSQSFCSLLLPIWLPTKCPRNGGLALIETYFWPNVYSKRDSMRWLNRVALLPILFLELFHCRTRALYWYIYIKSNKVRNFIRRIGVEVVPCILEQHYHFEILSTVFVYHGNVFKLLELS